MNYKIYSSQEDLYQKVISDIFSNPIKNLGLASGNTMIPLYQKLMGKNKNWGAINFFLLDEYHGLANDHPSSFHYYINKHFLKHIENYNFFSFNACADNSQKECDDYEKLIAAKGGIDLQLLGLGSNGHIAFNEPGSGANSRSRLVDLSQETIEANFGKTKRLATKAFTLGIANILEAKKIILIAKGKAKAKAVKNLLEGKESSKWPCTYLQSHSAISIYLDQEAASELTIKT